MIIADTSREGEKTTGTTRRKIVPILTATVFIFLMLAVPPLQLQAAEPIVSAQSNGFQNGMSFAAWWSGQYSSPNSDLSMEALAATGTEWISLIVTGYQDSVASTTIDFTSPSTPTDDDLVHAINKAHSLGLKVMLKPHVDIRNEIELGLWRGHIGDEYTTENQWASWFESYRGFIGHYAMLAQANGVDQFCIGTELMGTSDRADDWRSVAEHVRARFDRPITYAALHGGEETSITWWDDLDFIGVDSYYALNEDLEHHPTLQELEQAWEEPKIVLSQLSAAYQKPIILTEIGYRSHHGCTYHPWSSTEVSPVDPEEQSLAYAAAFKQLYDEPWLQGIFWWIWPADRFEKGLCDTGYSPYDKPAETILRAWYGGISVTEGVFVFPDYDNTLRIYQDEINSNWQDWSWDASGSNPSAGDQVLEGSYSLFLDLDPWGALSLHHSELDVSQYHWLEFHVKASVQNEPRLSVFLDTDNGTRLPPVPVNNCLHIQGGTIRADTWQQVRIPINDLNPWGTNISRISIQNVQADQNARLWIDNLRLVGATEEARNQIPLPVISK